VRKKEPEAGNINRIQQKGTGKMQMGDSKLLSLDHSNAEIYA
jgi:hypothetical protein